MADVLWLVVGPTGLRGCFGNLPMLPRCGFVDFTQRWAMAVVACLARQMELRVQAVFKVGKRGVWQGLHEGCRQHPDLRHVLTDSTIARAHAGAAGGTADAEALGRSKGGFATKIHAITDALGNPLDFILTAGQASGIGRAEALLQLTPSGAGALLGDKGYDSDAFVEAIRKQGMQAVIPPRSNRVAPRECDWFVDKERHLIGCFFGKIKHYRRVFSRFEKLARNYMGFIRFVSALIWLR